MCDDSSTSASTSSNDTLHDAALAGAVIHPLISAGSPNALSTLASTALVPAVGTLGQIDAARTSSSSPSHVSTSVGEKSRSGSDDQSAAAGSQHDGSNESDAGDLGSNDTALPQHELSVSNAIASTENANSPAATAVGVEGGGSSGGTDGSASSIRSGSAVQVALPEWAGSPDVTASVAFGDNGPLDNCRSGTLSSVIDIISNRGISSTPPPSAVASATATTTSPSSSAAKGFSVSTSMAQAAQTHSEVGTSVSSHSISPTARALRLSSSPLLTSASVPTAFSGAHGGNETVQETRAAATTTGAETTAFDVPPFMSIGTGGIPLPAEISETGSLAVSRSASTVGTPSARNRPTALARLSDHQSFDADEMTSDGLAAPVGVDAQPPAAGRPRLVPSQSLQSHSALAVSGSVDMAGALSGEQSLDNAAFGRMYDNRDANVTEEQSVTAAEHERAVPHVTMRPTIHAIADDRGDEEAGGGGSGHRSVQLHAESKSDSTSSSSPASTPTAASLTRQ